MKDFIKNLALNLWQNHRKKLVAFVLGLLFAGLAAISGIPVEEIKEAARDAAKPGTATAASTGVVAPASAPQAVPVPQGAPAK